MMKPDDIQITVGKGIYKTQAICKQSEHPARVLEMLIREVENMAKQDEESRKITETAKDLYMEYARAISIVPYPWEALTSPVKRYWLRMAERLSKCE